MSSTKLDRSDKENFVQLGSRISRNAHNNFKIAVLKRGGVSEEVIEDLVKYYTKHGLPAI